MEKAGETRGLGMLWDHRRSAAAFVLVFLLALFAVRVIQIECGADQAAFGSYPDEPSHFLSGVMIRDYLAHGLKGSPVAWATDYYLHIPFFAVGYWPPFFYTVEALWMLLFGVGWTQAMWLSGTITALTAATIFHQARSTAGIVGAACAGFIYLFWPPVQWSSCAVMTDTTVALLSLWASIALGRYLETERTAMALLFAVCAALTILTKYSGLFLALLPIPAVLLARRARILRKWQFWTIPAVVAVLWLPWLALTSKYATHGLITGDTGGRFSRLKAYLDVLLFDAGPSAGILLAGAWVCAAFLWRKLNGREIAWLLHPVAVLLFLVVSPIPVEARYLVPVFAPLILLAFSVVPRLAALWPEMQGRTPKGMRPIAAAALIVLTAVYARAAAFHFYPPRRDDVSPVADFVLHQRGLRSASILAPADDEGRFIADVAIRDKARGTRVLARPNKLFASIDWNSSSYKTWCRSTQDMEAFLDASPIDLLILHLPLRAGAWPHERLLLEMIYQFPDRWRRVGVLPAPTGSYQIFQFAKPAQWGELSPLFRQRMTHAEDLIASTPLTGTRP